MDYIRGVTRNQVILIPEAVEGLRLESCCARGRASPRRRTTFAAVAVQGFITEPLNELPAVDPAQFLTEEGTSPAQNLVAIL